MENNEKLAKEFCRAIKTIAAKEKNIENLELYLSHHFDKWLFKYANTAEALTDEITMFAEMEI